MSQVAKIIAQLDNFRTTKDGGGKITFEFGLDSMTEIKKILDWSVVNEQSFILAVAPYRDTNSSPINVD